MKNKYIETYSDNAVIFPILGFGLKWGKNRHELGLGLTIKHFHDKYESPIVVLGLLVVIEISKIDINRKIYMEKYRNKRTK